MKEEILKAINELPKVKTDNPISTMNGINVNDLMDAVERFDKVPTYQQLLEENKSLQFQLKAKEEVENTFKEWIATEQFRLARSVSHTYKDSLNKTHLVNEDIFDELAIVLDKFNEILSKGENK